MARRTLQSFHTLVGFVVALGCGSGSTTPETPADAGATADAAPEASSEAGTAKKLTVAQYNIEVLDTGKLDDSANGQVNAAVANIHQFSPDCITIEEIQFDFAGAPPPPGTVDGGSKNAAKLSERLNAENPGAPYTDSMLVMGKVGAAFDGYMAGTHDSYFENVFPAPIEKGLLSLGLVCRYPIAKSEVRVIFDDGWTKLPGNRVAELEANSGIKVPDGFPLMVQPIVVAPVDVDGTRVYLVFTHTTVPNGPAPNKYRNHDQLLALRLLIEGKLPGQAALPADAKFVLLGDWNADPDHGDAFPEATTQLLSHPLFVDFSPTGAGTFGTKPQFNTTASVCPSPDAPDPKGSTFQGRLDYLLPSKTLGAPEVGGMFFPPYPGVEWKQACAASNHMILWATFAL